MIEYLFKYSIFKSDVLSRFSFCCVQKGEKPRMIGISVEFTPYFGAPTGSLLRYRFGGLTTPKAGKLRFKSLPVLSNVEGSTKTAIIPGFQERAVVATGRKLIPAEGSYRLIGSIHRYDQAVHLHQIFFLFPYLMPSFVYILKSQSRIIWGLSPYFHI